MVEHRTVNARVAGSSPAIQAIRMWYSGCAPDSKSGDVGSNPAILANWRVCGSDNVGGEARGEPQHDAGSGERAVRDERLQEVLPRRVRQSCRMACGELRSGGVVERSSLGRGEVLAGMHCRHDGLRGVYVCSG